MSDRRMSGGRLLSAAAVVGLLVAIVAGVLVSRQGTSQPAGGSSTTHRPAPGSPAAGRSVPPGPAPSDPPAARVGLTLGRPERMIPAGFLGLSLEFPAVRAYTGPDPAHINPVLVALIRNLSPGQPPVLRIGGDSTDSVWVPAPGVRPPGYVATPLGPSWLATTAALAHQLNARMILGVNLVADDPALAAAEAAAYRRAFGPAAIDALEIGNEPNIYGKIRRLPTARGRSIRARPRRFGYPSFARQFSRLADAMPGLRLTGPALAEGPTPGEGSWVRSIPSFLAGEPRVRTLTLHRYPLRNCDVPPRSPQYPSIAHLLSPYAWRELANSLRVWVGIARREHRAVRDDEMNSVACRGKAGVSDTFASALWAVNALFAVAQVGVDGVNLHTLPGAAYRLFSFHHRDGRWQGQVNPVYYGLQMFAEAAPLGARLVPVSAHGPAAGLTEWATRTPDGTLRVVLVDSGREAVRARLAVGSGAATGSVVRLAASSLRATEGVTLGGVGYGASTSTGRLPDTVATGVRARHGAMTVVVPAGSAALVTVPAR